MDNERDALERALVEETLRTPLDLTDPMDQQWYLECEALNLEKYKIGAASLAACKEADANKAESDARRAEAERDLFVLKASQPKEPVTDAALDFECIIESDCAYCGSKFYYRGNDPDLADTTYNRFVDMHDPCGLR